MKRIITSAGLLAAGLAGLQAANTAGLTPMETSKSWSVSAALRGFYDDNVTTLPDDVPGKTSTWGIEVMPSIALNFPLEQTFIGLAYQYDYRHYFEDNFSKQDDQFHEFRLRVDHKFTDRVRLKFDDSFVYSSEPEMIDENISTPIRTDADAIRNAARLALTVQLTELFGLEAGYANNYYDYFDQGAGSRESLLDRMEHLAHLDARYTVKETLVALVGYQFGLFDYDGNASMYALSPAGPTSDIRDATSHYFYVGAEAQLMQDLSVGAKVGAQYIDYDNMDESDWSPWVDLSATYNYMEGSFVKVGFKNTRSATDVAGTSFAPTLDQEVSLVYASVTQRITPKLAGTLVGAYQNARFSQGIEDGNTQDFYSVGVNLAYSFNPHWSAEAGYTYDMVDADVVTQVRDFSRNRVYFGVRATY